MTSVKRYSHYYQKKNLQEVVATLLIIEVPLWLSERSGKMPRDAKKDTSKCFCLLLWSLVVPTVYHTYFLIQVENWNSPISLFFLSKVQTGHISLTPSIPAPTLSTCTRIPSQWKRKKGYSHSSILQRFPGCNGRALLLLEGWINR